MLTSQKKSVYRPIRGKWFNAKYAPGQRLLFSTAAMNVFPKFYGFHRWHIPNAFLKSTFEEIWNAEQAMLDETCQNRFRKRRDEPNEWLAEYWQYAKGGALPLVRRGRGRLSVVPESDGLIEEVCAYVKGQAGRGRLRERCGRNEGVRSRIAPSRSSRICV